MQQMNWEKEEAVILLDALIELLNGKITRKNAVKRVSETLRNRKIKSGAHIDEVFRNINGISLKISIMEYVYTGGKHGLRKEPMPKLFVEVVNLYKNNRKEFDAILTKENGSISSKNNADRFVVWLTTTETSLAQYPKKVVAILQALSSLLLKKQVTDFQILENTNSAEIFQLLDVLNEKKRIFFHTPKEYKICYKALILYHRFLSETERLVYNENAVSSDALFFRSQDKQNEQTPEIHNVRLNLANIPVLSFTKPCYVRYKGNDFSDVKSWADVYKRVLTELVHEFPDVIVSGVCFGNTNKLDIANDNNVTDLRKPKKLTNTLYYETNLSATDICRRIKNVFDLCRVDYSNVEIRYVRSDCKEAPTAETKFGETVTKSIRNYKFIDWMIHSAGLAVATANSYSSSLNACDRFAQENGLFLGSIQDCKTVEDFNKMYNALINNDDFALRNEVSHNSLKAALKKYLEYLTDDSKNNLDCSNLSDNSEFLSSQKTDIEKFVLAAGVDGVTYEDLRNNIGESEVTIRKSASDMENIIEIGDKLIHRDAFVDFGDGADELEQIIDKLMQKNNGYLSSCQLNEYAHAKMNMFLNDNDIGDERAVFDFARYLFEKIKYHNKQFKFFGNSHISLLGNPITNMFDLISKFADEHGGVFNYIELAEYIEQIGMTTVNLRNQMKLLKEPQFFYYEEGVLISAKIIGITDEWKSNVAQMLNLLFDDVGDHIILRNIPKIWFDKLPSLPENRKWTPLLLQGILRFYGEELGARTIQAMDGQSIETLHAMLVKNDSPIANFADVVIAQFIDDKIEQRKFDAEELRLELVKSGLIKGNELIYNMPKALKNDERFAWDAIDKNVMIRVE